MYVVADNGEPLLATGLHLRHGAAVHQITSLAPLTEVQAQLGHSRIDTTTIYTKLANPDRRAVADRMTW